MIVVQGLLEFVHDIEGIELLGICATKRSEEKLKKLSEEHGIAHTYTDYEEMLKLDEIDTVYVAINNHLHYEFSKKAILAGKHVICEKPFTVHVDELKELIALAKQHNVMLLEAITNQYYPNYLELKKQLSKAKEELNTIFLQKDDLLAYVIENGFHTADFLRQKAVLSIGERVISGKEDLKRRGMLETVERNIQERKRQEAKAAATQKISDVLHPELYDRLVEWRNSEAFRMGVPVYTVIQQKAILGISNLLPADKAMLIRVPYFGKKGLEKYGDIILEMVHMYRKEKGLAEPELML